MKCTMKQWVLLKLYLIPKRHPLKWNKCNYWLLFNKGAHISEKGLKRAAEIKPKTDTSILYYFLSAP